MQEEFNKTPISLEEDNQNVKMTKDYNFEKYSNIDGFNLDEEITNKFISIAKKLELSQESVELLMEIALEMSKKQNAVFEMEDSEKLKTKIEMFSKLFSQDKQIPIYSSIKTKEYMKVANSAYNRLCSPELKEIFKKEGLVCHPELIKMFHQIGELTEEDALNELGSPVKKELTPAQILYGTKN